MRENARPYPLRLKDAISCQAVSTFSKDGKESCVACRKMLGKTGGNKNNRVFITYLQLFAGYTDKYYF